MTFCHYGDYGDAIYSLSAVKELCDESNIVANYYLSLCRGPRELMTKERADGILPLLDQQPYLKPAWSPSLIGVRLHSALKKFCVNGYNLADRHNHYLDIDHSPRNKPWLRVDTPKRAAPIIISRSARYHSENGFPWKRVLNLYEGDIAFVGYTDEHAAFCRRFDAHVEHYKTSNMLEVAEAIAGCDLFIGNQSAARAVAEALKVAVVVEVYEPKNDTHWNRPGAWYCNNEDFWCPGLDNPRAAQDFSRYTDYMVKK